MERVDSFKYLGVMLDCKLTLSEHVTYIKSKMYAKIKLFGGVCHILDINSATMLYKTLILSVYDYCDFIYYAITSKAEENCAFHIILRVEKLTSTQYTHATLKV